MIDSSRMKLLATTIFILVICSHLILLASCRNHANNDDDDEFAEFDDVAPNEHSNQQNQPPIKNHQKPIQARDDSNDKILDKKEEEPKEKLQQASSQEEKHKLPDLKLVDAPVNVTYKLESYYIEFVFVLAILLYLVNYFAGGSKNDKFAHQWYAHARDGLKQQFALVGGAPQSNDGSGKKSDDNEPSEAPSKKQRGLIKSTKSMYTLWSSGRAGMDGLLIEVNLLKRQDLFNMALNLLKPAKDCIVLRFLLNQEGYDNFVFCLAHKTQAPKLAREMVDINTFCAKKKPASQCGVPSERLFVMSELSDVTSFILDQKTASFIKSHEQAINYIHITDQYSIVHSEDANPAQKLADTKRMATFSFAFPTKSDQWTEYLMFALNLLDRLRRFKLAKDGKQKSEKNRQKIKDILQREALSQRQEAAQAKKDELRRLEKERIYNEDDPEKQRRWEKKEAKRELKKNKMRVKQLKVKSM